MVVPPEPHSPGVFPSHCCQVGVVKLLVQTLVHLKQAVLAPSVLSMLSLVVSSMAAIKFPPDYNPPTKNKNTKTTQTSCHLLPTWCPFCQPLMINCTTIQNKLFPLLLMILDFTHVHCLSVYCGHTDNSSSFVTTELKTQLRSGKIS